MPSPEYDDIHNIRNFKSLIKYLRKNLNWPVDEDQADELSFEYKPAELGIDDVVAVQIKDIKQLRPLKGNQPWGVFWIQFEQKRLPVVVMRRILSKLVKTQRGRKGHLKAWDMPDLMFISATGEGNERGISFAHFQEVDGKPQLRTFAWDVKETHLYYIQNVNLDALRWPTDDGKNADAWREQWSEAFSVPHRYVPTTAEMLAKKMAQIASYIREAVKLIYGMEHAGGSLHQLHLNLKLDLISDLSEDDFADMYAQTVTYGLFAARATRSGGFSGGDAAAFIEHTNPFLRELLEQMMNQQALDLDELGVTELTDLLGKVNMEAILQSFGRQKRGEDPVIHFYETFMKEYDPAQKAKRGEFYTPDAVVSFIVRSVDYLLRTEFDCPDGLATATASVQGFKPVILDPATGTGTFLKYVIEVIWETFYEKNKRLSNKDRREKWNRFVRENVLPRLYAFELKMSPYTIAHMKVGLALQEKGFDFDDNERLQIYLSNALQPAHEVARVDTAALAHEAEKANEVKNKEKITVVIGNPPYAGHSANASKDSKGNLNFIGNLMQDYYKVDGKPLGERNPKWLRNDYVKFLRFAQWEIGQSTAGIAAMITDNSYLDSPTFRGMRQQLMESFDEIYILDLHGNYKKDETAPDGSKDENVFDITQGVSICLMVKKSGSKKKSKVLHANLFGLRQSKYDWLITQHKHMGSVGWKEIHPQTPYYLFVPQNTDLQSDYEKGWKITDIMPLNNMGITTGKNEFVTSPDKEVLIDRLQDLANKKISDSKIREKYELEDSSSFSLTNARNWAASLSNLEDGIHEISYRFGDNQFVIYSSSVLARDRFDISQHFFQKQKNLGIVTFRAIRELPWEHISCTQKIITKEFISSLDNCYLFPLYVYPETSKQILLFSGETMAGWGERTPNFSPKFLKELSRLDLKFTADGTGDLRKSFGPEDVFHYMYAVFHSPTYRSRYAEFLKIDFPRLPLTGNVELFRQLCGLGKELVALHLLEASAVKKPITKFKGKGDNVVAKGHPKYQDGVVLVNPSQGFEGVSEDVWEFHIGGYQVCEKWLKDRRGWELSAEDILHYQKVVVALKETIRLMAEVDRVIEVHGGWPVR